MNRKECLKIMVRCVAFVVVFSMLFGNATDLLMPDGDVAGAWLYGLCPRVGIAGTFC